MDSLSSLLSPAPVDTVYSGPYRDRGAIYSSLSLLPHTMMFCRLWSVTTTRTIKYYRTTEYACHM